MTNEKIVSELYNISGKLSEKTLNNGRISIIYSDLEVMQEKHMKEAEGELNKFVYAHKPEKAFPACGVSELKTEAVMSAPPEQPLTAGKIMFAALSGFILTFCFALFVVISAASLDAGFLEFIGMMGTLVFFAIWIIWAKNVLGVIIQFREDEAKYRAELEKLAADADAIDMESFFAECADFDDAYASFVATCTAERDRMIAAIAKKDASLERKADKEADALRKKNEKLDEELAKITIIHPEYHYLAYDIAKILEYGRADTLKEALNIALADERAADEEEERRQEAARQEAILERQAAEEAAHNREMRNMAEREAEKARKEAEDARRREQSEKERAKRARCSSCANRSKCSYSAQQVDSCGSFVPR